MFWKLAQAMFFYKLDARPVQLAMSILRTFTISNSSWKFEKAV